ncbi:MAG: T9SS type A sorting domain-containing protein [Clostridiales bacterium]|nr:T9SS type A sorting domain-containing protein [Clostridiales bacterium]
MKIRPVILSFLVILLFWMPVNLVAQRHWEEMESELVAASSDREPSTAEVLDVTVRDGYVYVTTSKTVTVKIFSILGQLISEKKLHPGTSRTRITARGIYILKVGTQTRRITI